MDSADQIEIQQLVNRYPYHLDAAQFDDAAALFADADVYFGDTLAVSRDVAALAGLWRSFVKVYSNGTPRTRHLMVT